MTELIRVVLADDHQLMLSGIRRALESDGGFEIVGEPMNGRVVSVRRECVKNGCICVHQ